MNIQLIKVPWVEAFRQHRLYCRLQKHTSETVALKRAYWHLKQGRAVLDVFAAFQACGVNADGDPKLAIARATQNRVGFRKHGHGAGSFEIQNSASFALPDGTFPEWQQQEKSWGRSIVREFMWTQVPIVPVAISSRLRGSLSRYHILWEAQKWDQVPHDPILLMKLSKNLFIVMAQWDLTLLEQAIVRGR